MSFTLTCDSCGSDDCILDVVNYKDEDNYDIECTCNNCGEKITCIDAEQEEGD